MRSLNIPRTALQVKLDQCSSDRDKLDPETLPLPEAMGTSLARIGPGQGEQAMHGQAYATHSATKSDTGPSKPSREFATCLFVSSTQLNWVFGSLHAIVPVTP